MQALDEPVCKIPRSDQVLTKYTGALQNLQCTPRSNIQISTHPISDKCQALFDYLFKEERQDTWSKAPTLHYCSTDISIVLLKPLSFVTGCRPWLLGGKGKGGGGGGGGVHRFIEITDISSSMIMGEARSSSWDLRLSLGLGGLRRRD